MEPVFVLVAWVIVGGLLVWGSARWCSTGSLGSERILSPPWAVVGVAGLLTLLMGVAMGLGLLRPYDLAFGVPPFVLVATGAIASVMAATSLVRRVSTLISSTQRQADSDALTGLWNRHVLVRRFQEELSRVQAFGGHLAFILMDVDNFKAVNDTYGHGEGDRVLRDIARMLSQEMRAEDCVARYGGDEFAILMRASGSETVDGVLQRIRNGLARVRAPQGIALGLSIGIAECPKDGRQVNQLTSLADYRMYLMKGSSSPGQVTKEHMPTGWVRPKEVNALSGAPAVWLPSERQQLGAPEDESGRQWPAPLGTPAARAFWVAAVLAGSAALVHSALELQVASVGPNLPMWLLLLGGAVAGELFGLDITIRGAKRAWTFSDAFIVALVYLFSAPVAVLSGAMASAIGDIIQRKAWFKVAFNLATYALGLTVACQVRSVVSGQGLEVLAVACGAGAYYLTNNLLVCTIVGLSSGKSPLALYRYDGPITLFSFASLATLGVVLAMVYAVDKVAALMLLCPIFGVYYTLSKYLDLQAMTETTFSRLTDILERSDRYTADHSNRVAALAVKLGEALSLDEMELRTLELVGRLHDIGKVGVANETLQKPTVFNREEAMKMQQHPVVGYELLRDIKPFRALAFVILCHHERWDGGGYPEKLSGAGIPFLARIIAVADTFDAMTSDRPYRKAMSPSHAAEEILSQSGLQFDPAVVDAFLEVMGVVSRPVPAPAPMPADSVVLACQQ